MKKGFTMIELIFVIVILGILAAVAIPRLAATRDDAEISKAATNLSTVVSDITAYYTAKTEFASNVKNMTNVSLSGSATSGAKAGGNLQLKGKDCIQIDAIDPTTTNIAYVHITKSTGTIDPLCDVLAAVPSVNKMLTATDANLTSVTGVYPVGGSNVVY